MLTSVFVAEGIMGAVRLVPAWHPRVKMTPEYYVLPPREKRVWCVPLTADEEEKKAMDFAALGEEVRIISDIPQDILQYSAVRIRQQILDGVSDWRDQVPDAIARADEEIGFTTKIRAAYNIRQHTGPHSNGE